MAQADFKTRACAVYRAVSQVPLPSRAKIFASSKGKFELEVVWSQKDIDRGKKVAFSKSYAVTENEATKQLKVTERSFFQRDASTVCKESFAPAVGRRAVLVKEKPARGDQNSEPQQFIEVWEKNQFVKSISVKDQLNKKHGVIHDDDFFASFQLSSDGKKLLYIAEKKQPEAVSFFKKTPQDSDQQKKEADTAEGEEYKFRDCWGERLSTVVQPVVAVLDLDTDECHVVECGDDVSASQAQWVPGSNEELAFVGYSNEPFKFGFVACFNRQSALYHAVASKNGKNGGSCVAITGKDSFINFPRFNPQGSKLVFMECSAKPGSPHRICGMLKMVDWATKSVSILVDMVHRPLESGFTGIYASTFPEQCWSVDGERFFYSDSERSLVQIVGVDTKRKEARYVTPGEGQALGAYSLLTVEEDVAVVHFSSPSTPPQLIIAKLPTNVNDKIGSWTEVARMDCAVMADLKWRIINSAPKEGTIPYQSILLSPLASSSSPPLVVIPHGGPHGVLPAGFIPRTAALAALGFAVLAVNYHGSTGFGQEGIMSLLGEVGKLDVQETHCAAQLLVSSGEVDGNQVVVEGGSHGGFIGAHLIGQFPDFYKAACLINPVIELPSMPAPSDIPDWAYAILGIPYDPATPLTAEVLSLMLAASPITLVNKVKAGVLLALGGEDRRVPTSQGIKYYRTLKAAGKDVRVFWYPKDSHPLSSVDADADLFLNCALFIHERLRHSL